MERSFKIVLLGEGQVGKTTWIHCLISGRFENEYSPTLGVEVHPLRRQTSDGETIVFNIWDCAGVEDFGDLRDGYYIMTNGAILMYDSTRRDG